MFEVLKNLSMSYYLTIAITLLWVIDHVLQLKMINNLKDDVNEQEE